MQCQKLSSLLGCLNPHGSIQERMGSISRYWPCGATEWAAPTMVIPKKDNTVRVVSDFRELNKVIRRRVYPLPRIQDVLNRHTGYSFFTKLDVSIVILHF